MTSSAQEEDLRSLSEAVAGSQLSVALFDMSAHRILASSTTALEQFGLKENEMSDFDFVEASLNPDAVRRLVATILENQLKEWRWQSMLYAPDGSRVNGLAIGRMVSGLGSRVVCLARYELPESTDELVDEYDVARLLEPSFGIPVHADPLPGERRLEDRIAQLEQHLISIVGEVKAAGIVTESALAHLATVPGLADLSTRQWDVMTRLVAGERVPTIASAMYLSPSTVRNHLATIYRKVGVNSQAELLERVRQASSEPGPSRHG
jgi:DNA-binding CsgD family transcriptional regulator